MSIFWSTEAWVIIGIVLNILAATLATFRKQHLNTYVASMIAVCLALNLSIHPEGASGFLRVIYVLAAIGVGAGIFYQGALLQPKSSGK